MAGGGVESSVLNHFRNLDHSRVQFFFIVDSDSEVVPKAEIESLGGKIFTVTSHKNFIKHMKECYDIFKLIKPDIVHSHLNALSIFPLCAAKIAHIPVRIAHSHSTSNPHEPIRNIAKDILRPFACAFPTHLAACSKHASIWLFGKRKTENGRVKIIRNAIDIAHYSYSKSLRNAKRSELDIGEYQLVIGCVGRLSTQKNQIFAEDVFAQLLKLKPDALLLIVGGGPLKQLLQDHANSLGITNSVLFLGIRSDMSQLYQVFDALLFPSLYEGLGMVAIEAQASDLPVLASTNVPNEARIVDDLVENISIESGSEYWAKHLLQLLNRRSSEAHQHRKNRDKEIAAAGYDIKQSAESLSEWYEQLVEQRKIR
ncbi:MAG: glycosyltransferase family 1 protein [Bifidobacterium aquikefiri]